MGSVGLLFYNQHFSRSFSSCEKSRVQICGLRSCIQLVFFMSLSLKYQSLVKTRILRWKLFLIAIILVFNRVKFLLPQKWYKTKKPEKSVWAFLPGSPCTRFLSIMKKHLKQRYQDCSAMSLKTFEMEKHIRELHFPCSFVHYEFHNSNTLALFLLSQLQAGFSISKKQPACRGSKSMSLQNQLEIALPMKRI